MSFDIHFLAPEPIKLLDEEILHHNGSLYKDLPFQIKYVHVRNYKIINEKSSNKFTIWEISIDMIYQDTSKVIQINKRYSDFVQFRERLLIKLPTNLKKNIPILPPTIKWYDSWRYKNINFDKEWLMRRKVGLEYFLNQILLNDSILVTASLLIKNFLAI